MDQGINTTSSARCVLDTSADQVSLVMGYLARLPVTEAGEDAREYLRQTVRILRRVKLPGES